jgi:hypothetical protein
MVVPPFKTSFDKVSWTERRLIDLFWEIRHFNDSNPYEQVVESHPSKPNHVVHKAKLIGEIPNSTINLAGEIIHGLRTALDNAVFDIAVASGVADPRNAAFPFAGTIDDMASALGRCKDIPSELHPLFCGFQPYYEGNDFLWGLNKLSNTDKHRILQPFGTGVLRNRASVAGIGGYWEMPDPHVWDSEKNEMVIMTVGPGTQFNYEFDFHIYVAFGDIEGMAGRDAIGKLTGMGTTVYRVLRAIEAECRRQKIVP